MKISISRRADVNAKSSTMAAREALGDGLVSSESCIPYLHGSLTQYDFEDGKIRLSFDNENAAWRVATHYLNDTDVPQADIDKLVEFTLAQWSDGLGEGCFDQVADDKGLSINLAPLEGDSTLVVECEKTIARKPQGKPSLALYKAAQTGDLEEVRALLDDGADIEFGDEGHTPLHNAVLSGRLEIALELLERGADPFATYAGFGDGGPVDALMEAGLSNEITDENAAAIAEALIARGVSPNGERDGLTPLDMADVRGKSQMADVLRKHGATA